MSRPTRGGAPSRRDPVPLAQVLGDVFRRLPPVESEDGPPPPSTIVKPPSGALDPGRVYFDAMPQVIRAHRTLSPTDKLVYCCLVNLCWGKRRDTDATNAKIRERSGGTSKVEVFVDKIGRKRSRTVRLTGLSDDTIQRSIGRLIRLNLVSREDDPLTLSTRRLRLLDLPSGRPEDLPPTPGA
jgi:hypothetical protein